MIIVAHVQRNGNAARKDLFTLKWRDNESILPTGEALVQHAKKVLFRSVIAGESAWKYRLNLLLQASGAKN